MAALPGITNILISKRFNIHDVYFNDKLLCILSDTEELFFI